MLRLVCRGRPRSVNGMIIVVQPLLDFLPPPGDMRFDRPQRQVQNVGDQPTKAMVILWGEAGYCPPQDAGPLKIECSGLLRPGSAWSFAPGMLPVGAASGIVYSLNAIDEIPTLQGNPLPFADVACRSRLRITAHQGLPLV